MRYQAPPHTLFKPCTPLFSACLCVDLQVSNTVCSDTVYVCMPQLLLSLEVPHSLVKLTKRLQMTASTLQLIEIFCTVIYSSDLILCLIDNILSLCKAQLQNSIKLCCFRFAKDLSQHIFPYFVFISIFVTRYQTFT